MRRLTPNRLAIVVLLAMALAQPARASVVNVRIEGKSQTLFEGPVRTEGHPIRAASDSQERQCNGTNAGAHASPGPTPTTAAVDAMALLGETFDGTWYPDLDDYLITRWGPEAENAADAETWGVLVDDSLLSVGGCQAELAEGAQVLWAYGASSSERFLTLYGAGEARSAAIPTPTAALGRPLSLKVESFKGNEGVHSLGPFAGAAISPVTTAANGVQTVETGSSATVTTGAEGTATVTFTTPGWHRLKATAAKAFRSNRIDVCVPAPGASGCGAPPPEDEPRPLLGAGAGPGPGGSQTGEGGPPKPQAGSPGSTGTGTGRAAELRIDGVELTPLDDSSARISYRGPWRRLREAGAWGGTVSVGRVGARLTVHLAAGRPVFVLRDARSSVRIELIEGTRRETISLPAIPHGAGRFLLAAPRSQAGATELRILRGSVGIDAIALMPPRA